MRRLSVIAALLIAIPWPGTAPAQSATQTIRHIEDRWLHANSAGEAAQILASDFVGVSTQGVVETREQRLARFRSAPQPPATAVHFEHLTVAFPTPDVAIATGQVVATAGSATPVYIVTFSDTFCLRHGRWLAVHAQETLVSSQGH